MSKFGWSYPPGCSGPPYDDREPDPRVSRIEDILDEAYLECAAASDLYLLTEQMVDEIRKLANGLSDDLICEMNRECPACIHRIENEA